MALAEGEVKFLSYEKFSQDSFTTWPLLVGSRGSNYGQLLLALSQIGIQNSVFIFSGLYVVYGGMVFWNVRIFEQPNLHQCKKASLSSEFGSYWRSSSCKKITTSLKVHSYTAAEIYFCQIFTRYATMSWLSWDPAVTYDENCCRGGWNMFSCLL
jgi:hypothetical protein